MKKWEPRAAVPHLSPPRRDREHIEKKTVSKHIWVEPQVAGRDTIETEAHFQGGGGVGLTVTEGKKADPPLFCGHGSFRLKRIEGTGKALKCGKKAKVFE